MSDREIELGILTPFGPFVLRLTHDDIIRLAKLTNSDINEDDLADLLGGTKLTPIPDSILKAFEEKE